ncbi:MULTISPECIES: ornithine cyclodeaminase family protein [Kordiimonas]|jgi:ornithine cyclodeaminase|uniref:ornithine cyclodeaminase family protein n=1 Tax=Kordiimonas TaxID=288021 RepID=UPI0025799ABC|nr:ornithine cyclodeaminase family protein [Kordiimonas sp. UBA4487]
MVQMIDAAGVAQATPFPALVDALEAAFRKPPETPRRHHYDVDKNNPGRMTLLNMPAWEADRYMGVKLVSVAPENTARGLPTVSGFYLLFSAQDGQPLAFIDAAELTARRTAAASALASRYLSRPDAKRLLVVGTGKLSAYMAQAHAAVRDFDVIEIWGRNPDKAEAAVDAARAAGLEARVAVDLEASARQADVISCVTSSARPVISGDWLKEGTHLDLVGAYRPDMREVDDSAIRKARIFVDTFENALHEAGEILIPMKAGVIARDDVLADLFDLAQGRKKARISAGEVTLFKSVGTSLEDYAGACLVVENLPA